METYDIDIESITMSHYNPRKDLQPDDEEYKNLKRSIKEFGSVIPVIINERNYQMVSGHQRYKVMKDLGYQKIPCVFVNLNSQDEKVLNVGLNKIEGDWNRDKLEVVLAEFRRDDNIDEALSGFSTENIDAMIGDVTEGEQEGLPEETNENETEKTDEIITCPRCQHADDKELFKIG